MTTIGVTGVTGHVGGRTARLLAEREGLGLRLFARAPERAPRLAGADVVALDFGDPEERLARAFEGLDALLFVSGTESADRDEQHRAVARATARAGVGHVVYTSFVGASPEAEFTLARDHGATEKALREAGTPHTFLRDNFYLDVLPFFADEGGVIRGPAADGWTAAVARADVADAAVAILTDPAAHAGRAYDLTGREALTFTQIAARASAALGRRIRYHAETIDEAYASRRAGFPDAPDWELDAWVSTYTAIAQGLLEDVSGDVRALTGHEPRVLEDVLAAVD